MDRLLIILCLWTFPLIVSAKNTVNICLTGTTVKFIPGYGEAYLNGAKLAKKIAEKKYMNLKVHILEKFYDRSESAALRIAKNLVTSKCDAIVGFSTGTDLISIKDVISKNPIYTLSIYGDQHPSLLTIPHLTTMAANSELYVDKLFTSLENKIRATKKFLIVTAIDRAEMTSYRKTFVQKLDSMGIQYINARAIEKIGDYSDFKQKYKKLKNEIDGIILLTRSVLAAKITDFVRENKSNTLPLLIGTKYFGSSALPAYYNYLKSKNVVAYFSRLNCLSDKEKEFQSFIEQYLKDFPLTRFKHGPMVLSAYVFDAVSMIVKSAAKTKIITRSNLLESIKKTQYNGITGINFLKDFKIIHTRSKLVKVTKKGYECVE